MGATSNVLLIIIGIFLPPVSVFLMTGCSCDLLINICLTVLGYFPGHIHCFWLIYKKAKAEETYGVDNIAYHGNGTYVAKYGGGAPQAPLGAQTYGTIPAR